MAIAIVLTAACTRAVTAQKAGLGLVVGSTSAYKFDNAVGAASYVELRSIPLRLQFQFLTRSDQGRGIACIGIPPSTCAEERIEDQTRSWAAGIGWFFSVLDRSHWQLGVPIEVMGGYIDGSTQGLESGRRLDADGKFLEFGIGPEIAFKPAAQGPFSLRMRGSRRGTLKLEGSCADCYEPYWEGFSSWIGALSLEYAWRR
jgi:hypothetical protein